mgnify:CR=1 FL=1
MPVSEFQHQLIKIAEQNNIRHPLSEKVKCAFMEVPRHKFIPVFRIDGGWIIITENNLEEYLPLLYGDYPLGIYASNDQIVSTISQPSFVLRMIDMLKLEEGDRVFELGTGSGWNAALMSKIVGPKGKIISFEIIPELSERAKFSFQTCGITNVEVHSGDAVDGWKNEAPYDKAVFTAGAFDLPKAFHEQVRVGGLLLFVLKHVQGDTLYLMEKKSDHFSSLYSMECSFVPMTGKLRASKPKMVHSIPYYKGLTLDIYPIKDNHYAPVEGDIVMPQVESEFVWSSGW